MNEFKIPVSIIGSVVGFFSSGEVFHGMHGLGVLVFFALVLSCFVFREVSALS